MLLCVCDMRSHCVFTQLLFVCFVQSEQCWDMVLLNAPVVAMGVQVREGSDRGGGGAGGGEGGMGAWVGWKGRTKQDSFTERPNRL